jgi:hypothetical protein
MKFNSFEYRSRVKYVERVQAEVARNLENEEVLESLGGYALKLVTLVEGIYVPNIKNGVVSISREDRESDSTPVIGIKPGEVLRADSSLATLSPIQLGKLEDILKGYLEDPTAQTLGNVIGINIDLFTKSMKSDGRPVELGEKSGGFCNFENTGVTISNSTQAHSILVGGRHLVALGMRGFEDLDRSLVCAHELWHVAQSHNDPTSPYEEEAYLDKRLHDELEAGMVGIKCVDPLIKTAKEAKGNFVYEYQKHTDNLRILSTSSDDPFNIINPIGREMLIERTGVSTYNKGRVEVSKN